MLFTDITLIGILILAIVLLITMLTNLFLFVPYVPTPKKVVRFMIDKANLKGDEVVYDLGCGDGRLLIDAKRQYPNIRAIGYELSLGVWMLAKVRSLISHKKVEFHLRNFFGVSLNNADIIFLYLVPEVMLKVERKLNDELRSGTRVISHGFALPDREPVSVERCALPSWHFLRPKGKKGPRVYVYEW